MTPPPQVLRMFVTGAPPNFGGAGVPQRISVISAPEAVLRSYPACRNGRLRPER